MKDFYKLLSDIERDENEMKEIEEVTLEVSEIEKARVKARIKKSLNIKKPLMNKGLAAAAVVGVLVAGTLGIGIANPSYAAELPIVGDIFRFLDNGRTGAYDLYKENASEINVTKESKGIAITIKEALFDGKTIYYTYEVKTNRDLGERPLVGMGPGLQVKGYEDGMTGGGRLERMDASTYIGQDEYTLHETYDRINCKIKIQDIAITGLKEPEIIKGKWIFDLQLEAVESAMQDIEKSVDKEGFTVTLNKLYQTPMSFRLEYTQEVPEVYRGEWDNVTTTLEVKDDLGNVYAGEHNGGHGKTDTGIMNWSMTFGKLDEAASELLITPKIDCSTMSGGVSFDAEGNETPLEIVQDKADREIELESIRIKLNK